MQLRLSLAVPCLLAVLSVTPASSLVIRANAISIGGGLQDNRPQQFFGPFVLGYRAAELAVGSRFGPRHGLALGLTGLEEVITNAALLNGTHGPLIDLYAFTGPPGRNWHSSRVFYAKVGVKPWGRPLFVHASLGASFTYWVLNPELEFSYNYLRGVYPEYDRHETQSAHQVGAFLRVGLGGWHELGRHR